VDHSVKKKCGSHS